MLIDLLMKVVTKLIDKYMTVEDLLFLSFLFTLGIVTTLLYQKFWKKPVASGNDVDVCPLTGKELECKKIPPLIQELKKIQAQMIEAEVRVSKIMNILSKEYEGQWDRYLYDNSVSPREEIKVKSEE